MASHFKIPIWKPAPFIRILIPFLIGIILQWYCQLSVTFIWFAIVNFSIAYLLFYFLPLSVKFKIQFIQGFIINCILLSFGLLITWNKDMRHNKSWYGNVYTDSSSFIVTINEPPIEKAKSYKAEATIEAVIKNANAIKCTGKLLIYFSKDSIAKKLHYGDKIIFSKNLQQIKNAGNPGSFNYQQYVAFQQIFNNVFLKDRDWILLNDKNKNFFKNFIFNTRDKTLSILQKNIDAQKDELGIAEALLIGYTNDLDKDLVQAYSNTGVVHIIAISGMHLGLIYVMLVWLFAKIPIIKKSKWVQAILILSCLWIFSILTGGAASVLRSAVMFTFITMGKTVFQKHSSIYNSLAASAFAMLVFNPYFLWDVGFQLSYLAVVGIIIFQKPIYNLIFFKNKWVDKIWQMIAVTLSAQILTFAICIYYFHQFPNLFLISNLIALPLSDIILFAEIALVAFSWIPFVGQYLGKLTGWLVWIMNKTILFINSFSFSVWDKISASILSTILLYALIIFLSLWLFNKTKRILYLSLISLLSFLILNVYTKWNFANQHKIIVYNVPQHKAIDFVSGNDYVFFGDSILLQNGILQNFHLKPTRIVMQLNAKKDSINNYCNNAPFIQYKNKKILVIDKPINITPTDKKIDLDIIIISKNPKLYISQLAQVFNCKQYVADASNSLWKIDRWKKDCTALHLQLHSTPEKGAFVLDL